MVVTIFGLKSPVLLKSLLTPFLTTWPCPDGWSHKTGSDVYAHTEWGKRDLYL